MQKVYKTMKFEIILQNGIERISPFKTCLILRFDFHLPNNKIVVKTVCAIRKCHEIPPKVFQVKL